MHILQTCARLILVLLCIPVFLPACAVHRETYFHQEQPRQPQYKTGQKPYIVNGKRYEPLSSHEGFVQDGVASSYGRDFHGRKTSSGEPFDMYAMTAAHKTLPLGVYVKVQHIRNGKEIIVRINDRGPFVRDRIIDLSEGAADKLDMLREGLATVRVTALGYRGSTLSGAPDYRAPASYDSGSFALQVAALKNRENAYRYAEELKRKHGAADVQEALINGSRFYRVRMGHYVSLRAAQAAQENYDRKGFGGNFVVSVE